MATFLMFGKYSREGLQGISAKRTEEAKGIVTKFNGEIKAIYALLGEVDLVCVATFPGVVEAMKASVALSKLTGMSIKTSPAITADEFDKIMTGV